MLNKLKKRSLTGTGYKEVTQRISSKIWIKSVIKIRKKSGWKACIATVSIKIQSIKQTFNTIL